MHANGNLHIEDEWYEILCGLEMSYIIVIFDHGLPMLLVTMIGFKWSLSMCKITTVEVKHD